MCLALPGLVLDIADQTAEVDFDGAIRAVRLDLLPDTVKGDYVLVHAGFAIERLDHSEAQERLDLFKEMGSAPDNDKGEG